jgi:predicted short-subunit dehydrogenase-like oxidoreductase (DUF2520 family)
MERGWRCTAVRGRHPVSPSWHRITQPDTICDTWDAPGDWSPPSVLLVTVPDRELETVAGQLARGLDLTGRVVLHTSGLHTADAVAACRAEGASVASWHPLQSFTPPELGPIEWAGVWCAIEGDSEAVSCGFDLARTLDLHPWRIAAGNKALYHASAAVAANLTHVLIATAVRLMDSCGLPHTAADEPLWPLVRESAVAAMRAPGFEALTGPVARRDIDTVHRHLDVLPGNVSRAYAAIVELVPGADQLTSRPLEDDGG